MDFISILSKIDPPLEGRGTVPAQAGMVER